MTNEEEEYITLFCEGDGGVGLNNRGYPRIDFWQKERDVLEYIALLTENGHIYQSKHELWQLEFNGSHCIPLLEIFSRHVVSKYFLERLNKVLEFIDMPPATQHPLTLSGFIAFWDAEGCSGNQPEISISQKDSEVLDLIVLMFGGGVHRRKDGTHEWRLGGKKAHIPVGVILERSHCPARRERLRQNFEGPTYLELHREEHRARVRQCDAEHKEERSAYHKQRNVENAEKIKARQKAYDKKKNEERKAIREWIKTHPEEVAKLEGATQ